MIEKNEKSVQNTELELALFKASLEQYKEEIERLSFDDFDVNQNTEEIDSLRLINLEEIERIRGVCDELTQKIQTLTDELDSIKK